MRVTSTANMQRGSQVLRPPSITPAARAAFPTFTPRPVSARPARVLRRALYFLSTLRALSTDVSKVDMTYDVVVVGSGASGLTTVAVIASRGAQVLIVEKAVYFSSTTAYLGGGV